MFRGKVEDLYGPPGSLCLIAEELDPTPGGVGRGAHHWRTVHQLVGEGWHVHVLFCAPAGKSRDLAAHLAKAGIGFSRLDDYPLPRHLDVPMEDPAGFLIPSERVRHALEDLHRREGFDLVEFAERGALAFRVLQARRAGLAFEDLRVIVTLHGSSQWQREQDQRWLTNPQELELDYAERYSFEQADFQGSADPAFLEHARQAGWQVRTDPRPLPPSPLWGEGSGVRGERNIEYRISNIEYRSKTNPGAPLCTSIFDIRYLIFDIPFFPFPLLPTRAREAPPLVTIAMPYFNLGAFLPEALASLAAQTYPNLEVLVINDGSTDPGALRVYEEQRRLYPQFRFLTQKNAGIGAARNRGLREARGEFFLPMDADNIAFPHMVERFVHALERNPDLAAMTCYFLAFEESRDLARGKFGYAFRPTGGPRVLAGLVNVYGDANALFRTDRFRAVGGYETDRDTSWEDWEAFVKLVNAGHEVGVVPEYLFAYRHREAGFSRITGAFRNHQRVLRQVIEMDPLPRAERIALWTALVSMQKRQEELQNDVRYLRLRLTCRRYRFVDLLHAAAGKIPYLARGLKRLLGAFCRKRRRAAGNRVSGPGEDEANRPASGKTCARDRAVGAGAIRLVSCKE